MGKYNKERFTITTLPRTLLRQIDNLKHPGESRNDVITRLIEYYVNAHLVKTPSIVQEIGSLVVSPPQEVVLPRRTFVFRKREVIGNW